MKKIGRKIKDYDSNIVKMIEKIIGFFFHITGMSLHRNGEFEFTSLIDNTFNPYLAPELSDKFPA